MNRCQFNTQSELNREVSKTPEHLGSAAPSAETKQNDLQCQPFCPQGSSTATPQRCLLLPVPAELPYLLFTRQWDTLLQTSVATWKLPEAQAAPLQPHTQLHSTDLEVPKNKHCLCHTLSRLTVQSFPSFLSCPAIPIKTNSYKITKYHF